jgi:glutathione S-transferase
MADVLRVSEVRSFGERPATEAYVTRVTGRTSFKKARGDQISHFKAADQKRANERSN